MMRGTAGRRATGRAGIRELRGRRERRGRLAAVMAALALLALLLSQAGRLPGPAGEAIRGNAAADRDATALFYTEVDGWPRWSAGTRSR